MAYRYSYEEQWQPKTFLSYFACISSILMVMTILFDLNDWNMYPHHFIEKFQFGVNLSVNDLISSAGLLYLYLIGYREDTISSLHTADTYHYIGDAFYQQVMKKAAEAGDDPDIIHIFAIVGAKQRANTVSDLVENALKNNFQQILAAQDIQDFSPKLDQMGNAFFKSVQHFFCKQPNHFPKHIAYENEDFAFVGICCGRSPKDTDALISLWLDREMPCLYGKQIMTHSFLLHDLIGRKVVSFLPQTQTGSWKLIFEGGIQVSIGEELSYMKETIHPMDLGGFCSSNLQTILMNPVYAYGTWLQPNSLCEEWHKVFLYLCATSEYVWDSFSISKVYPKFLTFLQDYICETVNVHPVLPKEQYHNALLVHIQSFRAFLRGKDEPVISKDLHQTINSRYVYLPYLWPLVPHTDTSTNFSPSALHKLIENATHESQTHQKGSLWEDVAAYVLENISGWKITGRRVQAGFQEIDISVVNISLEDALWKLGAYILVECKNWQTHVDLPQIRNLAHISSMKGNKTAILFCANGITKDAENEIHRLLTESLSILCITANDLLPLQTAEDCRDLILKKWQILQDSIHISAMI